MVVPNGPSAARTGSVLDPLRVVGRLGEPIDALLVDLEPLGRPELLADQVCQRAHAGPQRTTLAAHV